MSTLVKSKISKRETNATIIVLLFNFVFFLRHYIAKSPSEINNYSIFALALGIFSFFYSLILTENKNKIIRPFIFFWILSIFGLLSSLFTGNYEIQDYIIPFQFFGIGITLISFKLNYKLIRTYFYLIVMIFMLNIIKGVDPALMFNISRNYVSVVIITVVLLYYISLKQNNKRITILPSVITFLICVWAVGRGGILSAIVLVLGINWYINFIKRVEIKKTVLHLVLILIIIIVSWLFLYEIIFKSTIVRFELQGLESGGRDLIWSEYLKYSFNNFSNLFFGVSYNKPSILKQVEGNPHNAFIQLHMMFGLAGLVLVVFKMLYSLPRYIFVEKFNLVIFLVVLLRIFTDSGAFSGPFDPFLYYILFKIDRD